MYPGRESENEVADDNNNRLIEKTVLKPPGAATADGEQNLLPG